jgi:hypothetical protein
MENWQDGGHGNVDVGDVDDDKAGFVKYGPMDVREKMRDANAVMKATDEMVTAAKPPKDFLHTWTLTWVAWNRLWDRFNGLPGAVGQWRDTMYERADLYTRTALAFQEGAKRKTWLKAAVPPPQPQKAGQASAEPAPKQATWAWWQWALLAGVVAGGSYAAYRLWPKEGKRRGEISDEEAVKYIMSRS